MKKIGLLNLNISKVIAGMGHLDTLAVADAGLPIPATTERIDLAVRKGLPDFLSTLEAVLTELKVDKIVLAEEIKTASPTLYQSVIEMCNGLAVEFIPHEEFKQRVGQSKAVIRTGEFTPYANVILVSGVLF